LKMNRKRKLSRDYILEIYDARIQVAVEKWNASKYKEVEG